MLLIPAIDIKNGRCVRLRQGRMEDETVFADDPVAVAERWLAAGARRLHVVDLDGATNGTPQNAALIGRMVEVCGEVPVQVGGGIRDEEAVQTYLDVGVSYAIIGTKAVSAPHFVNDMCLEFPGHIIVGLDAREGKVAVDGWSKLSRHSVTDIAARFERDGVAAIIYTDISRDGMMQGVNIAATVALAQAVNVPVIASGGVSSEDDIRALCAVAEEGIDGAIIGRALYEGDIDLAKAQTLVDELTQV